MKTSELLPLKKYQFILTGFVKEAAHYYKFHMCWNYFAANGSFLFSTKGPTLSPVSSLCLLWLPSQIGN